MRTRLLMITAALALLAALSLTTDQTRADDHAGDKPAASDKLNTAPQGWTRLFDGESLVGWTVFSGKAEYDVVDGAIVGTTRKGSPNTFLCTTKTYGDFELQFEVKVHNRLNSGVQIRSQLKGDLNKYGGRITGPQVEIEASPGQSGYIFGEATNKGWLSPEPRSKDKAVNAHRLIKNDEWNHYHIIAKGDNIKTFINGNAVADLTLPDDIADDYREGVIGLQIHSVGGDPNWTAAWRNIYIKELE